MSDKLDPQSRANVIREIFEAIASVGFVKWQAEELMAFGYLPGEEDRQHYLKEFEKNHFAEFEAMTKATPDNRLLDMRADWIEMANAYGLLKWQEELSRDDRPRHEAFAQEMNGQDEQQNNQERGGRKR
jgi:hypothetical protein